MASGADETGPGIAGSIDQLLEGYTIYFAGCSSALEKIYRHPFGKDIEFIDVEKVQSSVFLGLLNQLDGIAYGDKSLASDKWVMLDCGFLPSGFVGLAKKVDEHDCSAFSIPNGYKGLVPVTEYCAIPRVQSGSWIGHTCATLIKGKGLGLLTKVLALKTFQVSHFTGVAQYDNSSVRIHTAISDLQMRTAITPAHSKPEMTFIYEHPVDQAALDRLFGSPRSAGRWSFLLDPWDYARKQEIQRELEDGARYSIVSPGHVYQDGNLRIPILER